MTRDLTLRLVPVKNIRAHPVRAAIILVLALAQAARGWSHWAGVPSMLSCLLSTWFRQVVG